MLLEGVLAVFALACVAVLSVGDRESGGTPVGIFAVGASKFFSALGVPAHLGIEFAMLAISTFLLTTLDTCTRLTRFLIEEFFNWRNKASRYLGTIGALLLPALLVFQSFPGPDGTLQPVWKAIWPLLGQPINCWPHLPFLLSWFICGFAVLAMALHSGLLHS